MYGCCVCVYDGVVCGMRSEAVIGVVSVTSEDIDVGSPLFSVHELSLF